MIKNNFLRATAISLFSFSVLFFINFCFAQSFLVTTDKKVYTANEQVKIYINFTDKNLMKNARGSVLWPDGVIQPIYDIDSIIKNSSGNKAEVAFDIYNTMPEGEYAVKIELLENEKVKESAGALFEIKGTKKIIAAEIKFCQDKTCVNPKKVFIRDETVYFKLDSSPDNLEIAATIKTPSGEIKKITFENNLASYSLKDAEEGSYSLWITFSQEGYQGMKIEKNFAVLDSPAEIKSTSMCNGNGKCESKENAQNCPQDCLPKTTKKDNKHYIIFAIAVLLVVAAGIIGFIVWIKRKSKLVELR